MLSDLKYLEKLTEPKSEPECAGKVAKISVDNKKGVLVTEEKDCFKVGVGANNISYKFKAPYK